MRCVRSKKVNAFDIVIVNETQAIISRNTDGEITGGFNFAIQSDQVVDLIPVDLYQDSNNNSKSIQ
ncbi:MAG: hypothetical protein HeimC2_44790 [Candidatus Heimdallarchaeota archaeon LC_2]|nr:MAG: hypothetical protein HeimC2_44790 [Candidatus Heimdallarchaeota archaeon LC_2]